MFSYIELGKPPQPLSPQPPAQRAPGADAATAKVALPVFQAASGDASGGASGGAVAAQAITLSQQVQPSPPAAEGKAAEVADAVFKIAVPHEKMASHADLPPPAAGAGAEAVNQYDGKQAACAAAAACAPAVQENPNFIRLQKMMHYLLQCSTSKLICHEVDELYETLINHGNAPTIILCKNNSGKKVYLLKIEPRKETPPWYYLLIKLHEDYAKVEILDKKGKPIPLLLCPPECYFSSFFLAHEDNGACHTFKNLQALFTNSNTHLCLKIETDVTPRRSVVLVNSGAAVPVDTMAKTPEVSLQELMTRLAPFKLRKETCLQVILGGYGPFSVVEEDGKKNYLIRVYYAHKNDPIKQTWGSFVHYIYITQREGNLVEVAIYDEEAKNTGFQNTEDPDLAFSIFSLENEQLLQSSPTVQSLFKIMSGTHSYYRIDRDQLNKLLEPMNAQIEAAETKNSESVVSREAPMAAAGAGAEAVTIDAAPAAAAAAAGEDVPAYMTFLEMLKKIMMKGGRNVHLRASNEALNQIVSKEAPTHIIHSKADQSYLIQVYMQGGVRHYIRLKERSNFRVDIHVFNSQNQRLNWLESTHDFILDNRTLEQNENFRHLVRIFEGTHNSYSLLKPK